MRRHLKALAAHPTQCRASASGLAAFSAAFACFLMLSVSAAPALAVVDNCPNAVFRTGPAAKLPECRAYELVSPPDVEGLAPSSASFGNAHSQFPSATVAPSGNDLFFQLKGGVVGDDPGTGLIDRYRVKRTDQGWISSFEGINGRQTEDALWYGAASPELDYYVVSTFNHRQAGIPNGSYLHTPEGFEVLAKGSLGEFPGVNEIGGVRDLFGIEAYRITPNAQHIVFSAPVKLEPAAPGEELMTIYDRSAKGPTHVVSLLPGEVTPKEPAHVLGVSPDAQDVAFYVGNSGIVNEPWYVRHDGAVTYKFVQPNGVIVGDELHCQAESANSYQWLRNGEQIDGAASAKYTVTAADEGSVLQCLVGASSSEGASLTTSAADVVEPFGDLEPATPPTSEGSGLVSPPSVTGTPAVGQLLTCTDGGQWKGNPTFTYQWLRNGSEIPGATNSTYTTVAEDKGKASPVPGRGHQRRQRLGRLQLPSGDRSSDPDRKRGPLDLKPDRSRQRPRSGR